MEKLLTISVAAYNVEQYLEQTLASLNDSRFLDDIEVLVVDDGSKDGTKDIALKYQAMAPDTFRYVGKENGGHGSTINMGMKLATGKYFRVLDGDDWVDTNGFARYIEALSSSDADLVLTQLVRVKGAEEKLRVGAKGMESGRHLCKPDDAGRDDDQNVAVERKRGPYHGKLLLRGHGVYDLDVCPLPDYPKLGYTGLYVQSRHRDAEHEQEQQDQKYRDAGESVPQRYVDV